MSLTRVTPDVFDSTKTFTISNTFTVTANVSFGNTIISANGSTGTAGQVLTSAGSGANAYWSTPYTPGKTIALSLFLG